MGQRALRGGLPRLFRDNRCRAAKLLRQHIDGLRQTHLLNTPAAVQAATLAALAWHDLVNARRATEAAEGLNEGYRARRRVRAAGQAYTAAMRALDRFARSSDKDPESKAERVLRAWGST